MGFLGIKTPKITIGSPKDIAQDFSGLATGETQADWLGIKHPFPIVQQGMDALGNLTGEKPKGLDGAYAAQLQAAQVMAAAQIKTAEMQSNAAIQSAQVGGAASIIGAALGAHTTSETIKQWTPSEAGAETIRSFDLAQKWNKTLQMRTAGYQDAAINYELSGKDGRSLHADPTFNSLRMIDNMKKQTIGSAAMFGIKSASNPSGVELSENDWITLHSYKNADQLLKLDPKVAAQRNAAYDKYASDMRASGNGLLIDLYENPQLAGASILSMKGKDPLLDKEIAEFLGQAMQGPTDSSLSQRNLIKELGDGKIDVNEYKKLVAQRDGKASQGMQSAINSLTEGDTNPRTGEVKRLMEMGIIDKYGMINGGSVLQQIPPSLLQAPEFSTTRDISEEERIRLLDQYKKYSEMTVDPKLIREDNMGMGVTRKTRLNADGTVAGYSLEGYMTDMNGNQHLASINGSRLQDWYDQQSTISGLGPTFPGMVAPSTARQESGQHFLDMRTNQLSVPNNGNKGQTVGQIPAPQQPKGAPTPQSQGIAPLKAGA